MQRSILFVILFSFISYASCNSYIRFFNPLQQELTISTDQFATFSLNFSQVSPYQEVTSANQQVSVINVESSGSSLTSNQPLLLEVSDDLYYTFVAYQDASTFYFVKYNETFDSSVDLSDTSSAFVRLLDTATGLGFVDLVGSGNPNSALLFQYIGQWELTAYKQVSTAFTSLSITTSNGQMSVPTSFEPGMAYTIAIVNDGSSYGVVQLFDRNIQNSTNTISISPSSVSSPGSIVSVNNPEEGGSSSSSKIAIISSLVAMAVLVAY